MAKKAVTLVRMANMILIRLRETTVTSVDANTTLTSLGSGGSPSYSDTLVRLINDAKTEVEEAYDWLKLQQTISVATSVGTISPTIQDSGSMTARQLGDRRFGDSQEYTSARTKVLSVWNYTTDNYLTARPYEWMLKRHNEGAKSGEQGEPFYFCVGPPGGIKDSLTLKLFPYSDAVYELEVNLINPQEDLEADEDEFLAPWHPIYLRALALAIVHGDF